MRQRLYQDDHPAIAQSLADLADDLRHIEDYRRARELAAEALSMHQRLAERQGQIPSQDPQ